MYFNLGMMLQINEIDQERHLQANYIEFLEIMSRAMDAAAIGPVMGEDEEVMSMEERLAQPLWVKIENTIPYFLANCTTKSFKDKFEHPKKDEAVGLYLIGKKKYF